MKKRLLLYLSQLDFPANAAVSATLAWLAKANDCLFDNYYDCYHQGVHFQGGDARNLAIGKLTGSTVCGGRHFQEFYFLLQNCEVSIVTTGHGVFAQSIKNLDVPVIAASRQMNVLYKRIFDYFRAPMPANIVMIGSGFDKTLAGLDAYLYPDIYYRQAIGVYEDTPEQQLSDLCSEGSKICCLYVRDTVVEKLRRNGYEVNVVDRLESNDNYLSITKRIALRWKERARGWILGDPILISHWLPTACESNLISIYGTPQEKTIHEMGHLISEKGRVVYGRQYSDRDFFELSRLNQCLQVIDPCRPPFQSVRHVDYAWDLESNPQGLHEEEFSDQELRVFAKQGRVLISLMFWSGMIRETENFHSLMDLIAMTGLKCGFVVTAQTYEYMMHAPFELLAVAMDHGGVYPYVEPVLGSCGIGVGMEAYMTGSRLQEDLLDGMERIRNRINREDYLPRGWWVTMDAKLGKRSWSERPKPARYLRYPPYIQIRYHMKDQAYHEGADSQAEGGQCSPGQGFFSATRQFLRDHGLMRFFEPYRPYEFDKAGTLDKDIIAAGKSAGLRYMFTKAGFNERPKVQYLDENFVVLNYTSGQWDGWTPFETVNDVSDLKKSEKAILRSGKPGWIVSTIDSCLWTFSGEFWKRGSRLFDIAAFCSKGGNSGELINVKPFTISRYARIIAENS